MLNYLPLTLIFIFCLIAIYFARRLDLSAEHRKKRRPFSDEVRLVRRPGESLFKQIEEINDQLALRFFAIPYFGMCALMLIGVLVSLLRFEFLGQLVIFSLVVITCSVFMVIIFNRMVGLKEDSRNKYLGYFGECAVAEYLDALKRDGYYVFHDVPGQSGDRKFNIDHVVVGPTGLFAIETKTRSRYWPIEEQRREQIEFDGRRVILSHGANAQYARQAIDQAVWLSGEFNRKYFVQAILTFPGWEVVERKLGTAWVLAPQDLAVAIRERSDRILTANEIDSIRSYLEKICRDVEY
jgi:hypothetical protein